MTVNLDGTVQFRLWAPAADRVELELVGDPAPLLMAACAGGWHELTTDRARPGSLYRFVLPGGQRVPDPASRYQPADVHGPSEVIDLGHWSWSDDDWRGGPWHEAVIQEIHIGTFTPEGTFRAAIDKLDHLQALGVTVLEIMPVADFPGVRNWGYDGVFPYAPDSAYGRPEDLRALVEAAHTRGLMVLLDVVYNHFGPEGNYLSLYAPQFFTKRHKTPWGAAINFDGPESRQVRDFFIGNALYWLRCFHFDGLRLDAVHAIVDDSPRHILEELAERVREATPGRHVHLVLENEENQARRLTPKRYDAQWNDDLHHGLHTAVTGEGKGYYSDYLGDTVRLGRAIAEGFSYQGELMSYRGRPRGEPCRHLPPTAFVAFLQNHDQIGNRAFGERLASMVPCDTLRAAAAVCLLLPQIPMLFMGEEWNARQPFPFFCDFGPELADAVRQGRREEFSRFPEFQDPALRDRIPDPESEATFASAKLRWEDLADTSHQEWLEWYRRILATRHKLLVPLLEGVRHGGVFEVLGPGAILARWQTAESGELMLAANLSAVPVNGFPVTTARLIWQEGRTSADGRTLQPWTVLWWLTSPAKEPPA